MKKILSLILILVCLFNFTTIVNAANNPATISVARTGTKYEIIDGLVIYGYKASGYPVYLLNNDTSFNSKTLKNPEAIYNGLYYIINNANPSSNTNQNYYITQVAILWYQDYLNNNDDNIDSDIKNYIESNVSNNSVCRYIVNLVEGAINYNGYDEPIVFETEDVTFTKTNSNYMSNQIKVTTNNLISEPTIKFSNAPTNTTVSAKKLYKDGTGYFYIKIPMNYYNSYNGDDFEVYLTGTSADKQIFKYSFDGFEAIYGRTYNTGNSSVRVSLPISINGSNINVNDNIIVRIKVLDENENYIKNIKYNIYKGNCGYTTCSNDDYIYSFTTSNNYVDLENILDAGTYTFVRMTDTNYDLYRKEVVVVDDTTSIQLHNFKANATNDDESERMYFRDLTITNSFNDSSNIIKIFKENGTLVDSFRSNETNYKTRLYEGNYYIKDTKGLVEVYFEINDESELLVIEGNKRVSRNNIDLDNYLIRYTTDTDSDNINNDQKQENVYTDEDGTIHIENLDGINSIDISNDVETTTDVTIDWISNIIDCPITSVSSTLKYIVGAIILALGIFLTYKNVKKHKNNI